MLADNPALAEIPPPAPVVAPSQGTVVAGAVVRTGESVAGVVAAVPAATAAAAAQKVQAVREAAVAGPTG
jgi:hypothetical protein